jgi:hypothetical protein
VKPLVGSESSRILHALILTCFGMVLTWPAWSNGYIPSRDVLIHLLWSTNFSNQLWSGDWYPRWLGAMNGGLGSPVFFFYAPLPYYLTALLKPLFHADPEGWHQIGVAASLAVILSGYAAYAWIKRFASVTAALVAAIVYMGTPYHLAFDLYRRFAFGELWAFVWLPLVLCGARAITEGSRKAFAGLALAYAALLLTHLPTAMIFSPVALAYAILSASPGRRMHCMVMVVLSMVLGVGLAAVYIVPALTTQQNVSMADMHVGPYSYIYHFLFYGPRPDADYARLVVEQGHFAVVAILACLTAFAFGVRVKIIDKAGQMRFWVGMAVLAFVMMLPVARPVWDHLPLLQVIQFPWRFNAILVLAMAVLIGLWADNTRGKGAKLSAPALIIACVIVVGQSLPTVVAYLALGASPGAPSMDKMLSQFGPLNREAREKVLAAKMSIDEPEYRPRWVASEYYGTTQRLDALLSRLDAADTGQRQSSVKIVSRSSRHLLLSVDTPKEGWIKLPQFYYPGWRASIEQSSATLPLRPSNPEGLIEIKVDRGKHEIVLELVPGIAEQMGWLTSCFSLGILTLSMLGASRRRSRSLRALS